MVIFLANAEERLTVYSLIANGDKIGTKNLANLYDGVLIASIIGLVPIFSPLAINEYTVKHSFAFAKEITKTDYNYVMASVEETIANCVNDLFFDKSKIDNLTKQDVHDLLSAAVKESFFIFANSLYRQIDGVAMGSPLGPTLANTFLCHYEKDWLDSCPIEFKHKLQKIR